MDTEQRNKKGQFVKGCKFPWRKKQFFKLICETCKKEVEIPIDQIKKRKYCSRKCASTTPKGNIFTKGHTPWLKGTHIQTNTGRTHFKKGYTPWHKGKEDVLPHGEKHHNWKGNKVSYFALHMWIKRNFGKPFFCFNCYSWNEKKYHWANISGKYTRELSNYVSLCVPCHKKFDGFLCGENHPNSRLSEKDVRKIRKLFKNGVHFKNVIHYKIIAKKFNVYWSTIQKIVKFTTWTHISSPNKNLYSTNIS